MAQELANKRKHTGITGCHQESGDIPHGLRNSCPYSRIHLLATANDQIKSNHIIFNSSLQAQWKNLRVTDPISLQAEQDMQHVESVGLPPLIVCNYTRKWQHSVKL